MPDASEDRDRRLAGLYRIVGAVVHDLSNPLQTLVTHAELADTDDLRSIDATERNGASRAATRRMQGILRAMTTLCSAGLEPRPLGDVVTRFHALLERRWGRLSIEIHTEIHERGNVLVPAALEETLLAIGIEVSQWLRVHPPDRMQLRLVAGRNAGGLTLTVSCADPSQAESLFLGARPALTPLTRTAGEVEVHLAEDRLVLACATASPD